MNSVFDNSKLKVLEGKVYEEYDTYKFRLILDYDHYDYVEDVDLIDELIDLPYI